MWKAYDIGEGKTYKISDFWKGLQPRELKLTVKRGFSLPDVVEGQAVSKKRKLAKDSETTERESHSSEQLTLPCGKSNCEFTAHCFQDLEDHMLLDVHNNKLNTYDKVTLKLAKALETVSAGLKQCQQGL